MNAQDPSATDEAILCQAAHWFLRMHGSVCSDKERLKFQLWLQKDPRHPREYAKMLEIWDLSSELPHNPATAKKLLSAPTIRHRVVLKLKELLERVRVG